LGTSSPAEDHKNVVFIFVSSLLLYTSEEAFYLIAKVKAFYLWRTIMTYSPMFKRAAVLLVTLFFLAGLSACSSSSSDDTASLRVVHASPDAPDVDVLLDDLLVLNDVPYAGASDYFPVIAGIRNVKVNAAATDLTVIEADLDLAGSSRTTIIASGLVGDIQPLVLLDRTITPAVGNSLVRVVHAAPSAPAVDVYATEPGAALEDAAPVLANVPFRAFSDYLEVPAGTYQFRVTVAGTTDVAIDSGALLLEDGDIFTVIARDATGGGAPLSLVLLND